MMSFLNGRHFLITQQRFGKGGGEPSFSMLTSLAFLTHFHHSMLNITEGDYKEIQRTATDGSKHTD